MHEMNDQTRFTYAWLMHDNGKRALLLAAVQGYRKATARAGVTLAADMILVEMIAAIGRVMIGADEPMEHGSLSWMAARARDDFGKINWAEITKTLVDIESQP